jgi:pimeloyl-ACP methyl ester carboxylesterase
VLLLHQINGGAEQWDRFAPVLHRAGFTTLAYSGRGGWDVEKLAREARGALRYLLGRDDVLPRRVSVVGASIGGATALWLSTTLPPRDVPATVALSPAMEKPLLDAQDAGTYRPHDVLFVTNGHDAYASRSLRPGTRRARVLLEPDGGHGVELLTSRRVATAVLDWLRR